MLQDDLKMADENYIELSDTTRAYLLYVTSLRLEHDSEPADWPGNKSRQRATERRIRRDLRYSQEQSQRDTPTRPVAGGSQHKSVMRGAVNRWFFLSFPAAHLPR